jgi:MoxR-like ATPase
MSDSSFSFQGKGLITKHPGGNWQRLNRRLLDQMDQPAHYFIEDPGLVAAVNTALTLGRPLLLTGEPGVGKTQLGYRIAYELGCGTIFFPVKSSTEAQDLFYQMDHLRRLHAAQAQVKPKAEGDSVMQQKPIADSEEDAVDVRRFLRFQALGLAILRAMPREQLHSLDLWEHAWPESERYSSQDWHVDYGERQPSVVLIDEIDKAPMDFCNDILEEIRRLQFTVPELGREPMAIYQDPGKPTGDEKRFRPQVIITSNSEKSLPEAFLRRCVYYQLQAPDKNALRTIIARRLAQPDGLNISLDEHTQEQSLAFFLYLKDTNQCKFEKPPSTAELLDWLLSLDGQNARYSENEQDNRAWKDSARYCLFKRKEDVDKFEPYYQSWQNWQKSKQSKK